MFMFNARKFPGIFSCLLLSKKCCGIPLVTLAALPLSSLKHGTK